ncbi:unnamed protein product [Scytosiphon promiscuus]
MAKTTRICAMARGTRRPAASSRLRPPWAAPRGRRTPPERTSTPTPIPSCRRCRLVRPPVWTCTELQRKCYRGSSGSTSPPRRLRERGPVVSSLAWTRRQGRSRCSRHRMTSAGALRRRHPRRWTTPCCRMDPRATWRLRRRTAERFRDRTPACGRWRRTRSSAACRAWAHSKILGGLSSDGRTLSPPSGCFPGRLTSSVKWCVPRRDWLQEVSVSVQA